MSFQCVKKYEDSYDKYVLAATSEKVVLPDYLDKESKKLAQTVIKKNKFTAKASEKISMTLVNKKKVIEFIIIGLGEKKKLDAKNTRQYLFDGLKNITGKVLFSFDNKDLDNIDILAEVVEHINYKFDKYFSKKKEEFLEVSYLTDKKVPKLIEGYELAKISNIVKDLVNEQAEVLNPKELADRATKLGKKFGFDVEILDEKKAQKLGMNAYLSVARAAYHRPYVIVMRYKGDTKSKYTFGLVGKGLTYDTGGLSLKPTDSMLTMRCDMGGAATMIGAMCSVAKMKLKKNVTCVVAACENSIGPNAYRPGDILTAMNGKTIEVTNTDAEGRLTLADALTYIVRKEKVNEVIDAATLTGAIMVALGEDVTGVFTNDDKMARKVIDASENWNEYFWQMPMFDLYKKNLKSSYADMQNTGVRWGGSTNAAKFLEEFIDDTKWVHLDIAGTAWASGANPYYSQKGATGQVFRTVYSYIKDSKN
ncbi:leucyl aminopeptidase [Fusobacterium sp. oral taxon 203]|uniref:leucyl aminopeptidase n=1 Tax=Fusobacterium sp. oral taxon 203 TaxID=671211 RepID=UPI000B9298D5|nr:leucyl aminopeptidase [Fusobacterium sp. oral taxon 203]ASS39157.1 aminopeptidase [Fusobacterium sp. oral taxon 203]